MLNKTMLNNGGLQSPLSVSSGITRRQFVIGGFALAGVSLLGPERRAHPAMCKEIAVATWGGDYGKLLSEFVEGPLKQQGVQILQDQTRANQRITKLLVEKPLRRGSIDVVHLNSNDMWQVMKANTLSELDSGKIPNLKNVRKQFENRFSIPHIFSAWCLLYNRNHVSLPDSYSVFWNPKYKGRVGIQQNDSWEWLQMAALIIGKGRDYDAGKPGVLELKKLEPKIYSSQEALAGAIKSEEVWLTPNARARTYMWQRAGMPIASAVPKEGAVPVIFRGAVARNARNPECGFAYLNDMLRPEAQIGFAKKMGYMPTITNAPIPEDISSQIGFTEKEIEGFCVPDPDYISKNASEWAEWWNKNFLTN